MRAIFLYIAIFTLITLALANNQPQVPREVNFRETETTKNVGDDNEEDQQEDHIHDAKFENGFLPFERSVEKINQDFNDDKTYEAFTLLDVFQKAAAADRIYFEDKIREGFNEKDLIDEFLNTVIAKKLQIDKANFELRYPQLNSTDGWNYYINEPKKKLFFRNEPGFKIVTQQIEAIIEAPYENIVLLLREADLLKHSVPLLAVSEVKNAYKPWRQLLYQRFNAPWPLKDREVWVEISGYMLPFEDAFVFSFETVQDGENWFGTKINKNKKSTEMIFNKSFGYLRMIGPNRTLFKFIINADPNLEFVPAGMIDWGIKTVTGGFLNYLIDSCSDPPKMYKERLQSKKAEYDQIYSFMSRMSRAYRDEE
ncbi:UNKNOWN [Stylonychia lemnae]|uniref:START domain-containing protein n=1 Tax=Stylonychia lemnae TaxID=5949 RepID=A0A078BAI5_STYLE|nr:UNKNOWN [Stylonychia lemnae]|eukprot:CDW91570.1 UNKNOWN [Stylonychia lemnae]